MRTKLVNIYSFDELSESAKEKAREWYRCHMEFGWNDESLDSIKTFCEAFGVSLKSWDIGPYEPVKYKHDATNANFRGTKLSSINREQMPTGYCLDNTLWYTFYDEFKRTGNAKGAFEDAIYNGFKEWRDDMEYQLSDEAVDDTILCNDWEFEEDGTWAR